MEIIMQGQSFTSLTLVRAWLLFVLMSPLVVLADDCPMKHIVPERLPDLNIARAGHAAFCIAGELTVAGGHTTGFVPTPTA